MAIYFGNKKISQISLGTVGAGGTSISLSTPTLSLNSATGVVTATVSQPTSGYLTAGSKSGTLNLSTQASRTITPSTSSQTAVAAGKYTLGPITVAAVDTEERTFTANGTYNASSGKFISSVIINVPTGSTINNQNKTVTPSTSQQIINADSGYTGLGTVTINAIPSNYIVPTGNYAITSNGTNINISQYATVSVNVPTGTTINNQNKTVTPSESQQSITADSGYTGLGTVTVNAISSTYVGSGITTRNSNSLTVNGGTVTAPAGYYASAASKSVATMTLPTAAAASASGTSKAAITPSTAAQYINIPTGYNGTASYYTINAIPSNYIIPSGNKAITANGTNIDVTQYATVSVNVPSSGTTINNQNKTVTPTTSSQSVTADSGYTGLGTVTVNAIPSSYIIPSGNKNITANGTNIDVKDYSTVSVAVPATIPNLQTKTGINPSTSSQTITADSGYDGLESVQINAMSTMSLPTTLTTSAASGYTRVTTVDRNTATRYINIPAGYHSGNEYYQISAVANGSVTAPSTISGTTATVSTGTNTLTLTKTVSVTPNVTTAGYISSGTAGNASVSLTASVTTKAAATYRASTSAQTIAAGTYLTGAQTIAAVSQTNLSAANIKAGTTISINNGQSNIWSVTGTFTSDATATAADINSGETAYVNGVKITGTQTFATIYMVEGSPVANSVGNDGDICIVRNMLL